MIPKLLLSTAFVSNEKAVTHHDDTLEDVGNSLADAGADDSESLSVIRSSRVTHSHQQRMCFVMCRSNVSENLFLDCTRSPFHQDRGKDRHTRNDESRNDS